MSRMGTRRRTLSGASAVMPEKRFEAAERFRADLVCIGSHGHSGLAAALMGSSRPSGDRPQRPPATRDPRQPLASGAQAKPHKADSATTSTRTDTCDQRGCRGSGNRAKPLENPVQDSSRKPPGTLDKLTSRSGTAHSVLVDFPLPNVIRSGRLHIKKPHRSGSTAYTRPAGDESSTDGTAAVVVAGFAPGELGSFPRLTEDPSRAPEPSASVVIAGSQGSMLHIRPRPHSSTGYFRTSST